MHLKFSCCFEDEDDTVSCNYLLAVSFCAVNATGDMDFATW